MSSNKTIVGITGGIASGKSFVADFFVKKGITVINADKVGHQILRDEKIKQQLVARFGDSIMSDNEINRKMLGKIVFTNQEELHALNSIVHPALINEILRRLKESKNPMVVIDAALLLQWNMNEICDVVILVTAPEAVRIERLMHNAHLSREEAKNRVHAQQKFSEERADFIITNNDSVQELQSQVDKIWEILHAERG